MSRRHAHHWICSQPENGLIHEVCKRCKLERDVPAEPETRMLTASDIRQISQIRKIYNLENRLMVMGSYGSSYVYD